jgi:cytochrome c-type biogenesis protein CcmH/NrfF
MSFNKRYLKKENILIHLNDIMTYLDADAVISTDEFSHNVYKMFNQGKTKEEIIKYIIENK